MVTYKALKKNWEKFLERDKGLKGLEKYERMDWPFIPLR